MLKEAYNNIAAYLMEYLGANFLIFTILLSAVAAISYFILLSYIITQLDTEYFNRKINTPDTSSHQLTFFTSSVSLLTQIGKIIVGVFLLICGILMLVLPGQGLLTIIIGLSLLPFPGKRKLEQYLLSRKSVKASLNWIRVKANKEPFIFE